MRKKKRGCWPGTVFPGMVMITALLLLGLFLTGPAAQPLGAEEVKAPPVEHPMLKPAHYTDKMKCPNCGMMLNMWARTRHQFHLHGQEEESCSIHCVAERAIREGVEPTEVKVALYLEPEKMIAAGQAFYVIGSSAPGTMTTASKLAFADRAAAEKFVAEYGGEVSDYGKAYRQAVAELDKDRQAIDMKRKKSGKIVEPVAADTCTVCGMRPAAYPNNRAQILTSDQKTLHFCSGQCLVKFLAAPASYVSPEVKVMTVWATVYPEGMFDYAGGLFYVVGSKAMGPMGFEPFAFRSKKQAEEFMAEQGGTLALFTELKPGLLGN
jgi:nitrous oxide reductase accessory protein NosL